MKTGAHLFATVIDRTRQALKPRRTFGRSTFLGAMTLCLAPAFANTANAQDHELPSACHEKKATVLVGGVQDDWTYFKPWVSGLQEQGGCVFGFVYDHTASTMPEGAALLSRDMKTLREQGFSDIVLLAHSMGGLVAKRALHLAPLDGGPNPVSVRFHAYGTPWGGFFWANFARFTPWADLVLRKVGLPMALDIGSASAFMVSLQSPLPPNVTTTLHNSLADTVATPQTGGGKKLFKSATEQAQKVLTYSDLGHAEYVARLGFSE